MNEGAGYGSGFALIVVLFILLIIVGSAYVGEESAVVMGVDFVIH